MRALRRFLNRLRTWVSPQSSEERLQEEIEEHIVFQTEENLRAGLPPAEARRQAILKFGAVESVKENYRDERGLPVLETLTQDIRYAGRTFAKSFGFAVTAVLTMALGIGATTGIFTVVDATLLHPLPYPHPEQLVRIQDDLPGINSRDVGMSEPEWQDLQHSGIFQHVSPTWYDDNNVTGSSQPERVGISIVAPDYFSLLDVKPELGRTFPPGDHSPGFTGEVVISDGLWKRSFGGDPNILGRGLRLDNDLYTVVGVMPPGFHDPGRTLKERNIEAWPATSFYGPPMSYHPPRSGRNLPTAIARLKPGLTIASAQTQLDALVTSLQRRFPGDYPEQNRWTVRLVPLKDSLVGDVRQSLILLLGAVGLVLLIGCVNVANLLLARASTRGREMALRQALGATRSRLIRQLLTESVLLSQFGGIAGVVVLLSTQGFLLRFVPETLPHLSDISISWSVLLFALMASLAAGAAFGIVPALHTGRGSLTQALKQEGRGSTGSGQMALTRRVLVITEFALSLVLMIAAGLLLHSFWDLVDARLGFNPKQVMTIKTRLPYPNDVTTDVYRTPPQQEPFFREVIRRARTLPGVEEAAMGDFGALPLAHDRSNQNPPVPMILEGRESEVNQAPLVDEAIVTPEYFHLMGMTLLRGRLFGELDTTSAPSVAVINEAMAQTYWPDQDPLGKHLRLSRSTTSWSTIVGVVADARTESLEHARVSEIYTNLYQRGGKHLAIFLRGKLDPGAIEDQVRHQVQSVDPTIPVFSAQQLTATVSASLAERRFSMEMVALFALTALLLAGVGIYGVISYIVNERTREISIRLALGARHGEITRMVLREGLALALAGAAIGLAGAVMISHSIAGLLYGIRPTDPLTFATVAVLLTGIAVLACYIPARRAIRVDPMVALRHE